jgi:hypothetical protein
MKYILSLLMIVPVLSFGQSYEYYGVVRETVGSDYFRMDKVIAQEASGNITFDKKRLVIDNRTYNIREKRERWTYKTKGGYVKLKYTGNDLAMVQLVKYNTSIYYYIKNDGTVATK